MKKILEELKKINERLDRLEGRAFPPTKYHDVSKYYQDELSAESKNAESVSTTQYIYHSDCGKGSLSKGLLKNNKFRGHCRFCGEKFVIKEENLL